MANRMRLGDIATYINGYPFKPEERGTEGLPIIRIQDLTGNSYDLGFYNGEYPSRIEINDGDVLISWSGSLGVYVWARGKALLNQHIFKVVFDKVQVDKRYFVFAVQHMLCEMEGKTHGATMKHIVKGDFDNTSIPFPSIMEQQEIAEVLSGVQSIIEARQRQLRALGALIKARFVEMFGNPVDNDRGWPTISLDDACDGIGDGLHGTPEYDDNGAYPFINGNNLTDGVIVITPATKMVDAETYRKHYICITDNAILISINGTLGKIAFYRGEKVMLGKSACYCNLKPSINREFVYGVMRSDAFVGFLEENSTRSTIKNVGLKVMRGFQLINPPEKLQLQYIMFARQVDKSKAAVQAALDKAQVLFDSLMQDYFG